MHKQLKAIKNDSGFTMAEMMVVVAIIAIGAAVCSITLMTTLPEIRLRSAIRDLKSDMNSAKLEAIRQKDFVSIQFDLVNEAYTIFLDSGAGNPAQQGDLVMDPGEPVLKTVNLPNGIDMTASVFGVNNAARYDRLGQPWGAGRVVMTNTRNTCRSVSCSIVGTLSIQEGPSISGPWTDLIHN